MAVPAIAAVLALCGCASLPGLDLFAPSPAPARPAAVQAVPAAGTVLASDGGEAAAVPDGRYAGLAVLTAFHGDCNAGGTGGIVVQGRTLTYHDDRNPTLSGPIGPHGVVDLVSGMTRLSGEFSDAVFTGRIAGGPCEYQMRFERMPD